MRQLSILVSVVVVLIGSLAFGRIASGTVAQEATPAAGALVPELLGHGLPATAPGFDLSLYRVRFGAGAVLPAYTHPGASVVYVESGSLGFTSLEGEAWLMRAGTTATPDAQGELLAHDIEVTLEAGDALFSQTSTATVPTTPAMVPSSSCWPTSTPRVSQS